MTCGPSRPRPSWRRSWPVGSVDFRNVTKRYENGFEALKSLSLSINEGSMTFLTGHSGAGKSTFLRLLLRLEHSDEGVIAVNDVDACQSDGLRERSLTFAGWRHARARCSTARPGRSFAGRSA